MDFLTKFDWKKLGSGAFYFVVICYVFIEIAKKLVNKLGGISFKASMKPSPPTSNDIIMELVNEIKCSNEENKQERAVIIKGLSASLEWISKQPGANGRIADARSKLEDWLIERGLQ